MIYCAREIEAETSEKKKKKSSRVRVRKLTSLKKYAIILMVNGYRRSSRGKREINNFCASLDKNLKSHGCLFS